MKSCNICQQEIVVYRGPKESPVLVLLDSPDKDDLKNGRILSGRIGGILANEFGKLGLDINSMRLGSFWRHEPNKDQLCQDEGFAKVVKEATDRKIILLLGSESAKFFTGHNVSDVCGLEMKSSFFTCPVICCPNPGILLHDGSGVGEVKFAIKKFAEVAENYLI